MLNSRNKPAGKQVHLARTDLLLKVGAASLAFWTYSPRTSRADEKPAAQIVQVKAPAHQSTRAAIFAHLEKQAQAKSSLPSFPRPSNRREELDEPDKLALWVEQRAERASKGDDKARYSTLLEHLLIAQELLRKPDLAIRRQGFTIAFDSANFAAAHLGNDKWLPARIYEGFLLPQVTLAHVENWESPSRQSVLEAAVSVFGAAGERSKQISVLEWLLSVGSKPKASPNALSVSTNTLDWARGTLASLLFEFPEATQEDRVRALSLLKSIQSPDMKGFKHLQSRVEASLSK